MLTSVSMCIIAKPGGICDMISINAEQGHAACERSAVRLTAVARVLQPLASLAAPPNPLQDLQAPPIESCRVVLLAALLLSSCLVSLTLYFLERRLRANWVRVQYPGSTLARDTEMPLVLPLVHMAAVIVYLTLVAVSCMVLYYHQGSHLA